jgi:hypothetical protein
MSAGPLQIDAGKAVIRTLNVPTHRAAPYPALRSKDRVAALQTERDIAQVAFDRAVAEMRPDVRITEEKMAAFAETMRAIVLGEEAPFRRAPARAVEEAAHRQQPILGALVTTEMSAIWEHLGSVALWRMPALRRYC